MEGSRNGSQCILHEDETLDKVNSLKARQVPKAPQALSGYVVLAVLKKVSCVENKILRPTEQLNGRQISQEKTDTWDRVTMS